MNYHNPQDLNLEIRQVITKALTEAIKDSGNNKLDKKRITEVLNHSLKNLVSSSFILPEIQITLKRRHAWKFWEKKNIFEVKIKRPAPPRHINCRSAIRIFGDGHDPL